jgi:hypothetical protein
MNNNITVSEIEEPLLAFINEPNTTRNSTISLASPTAKKKQLINEPQRMETNLRQDLFE